MIHHPLILGVKLVVLAIIVVILMVLHSILPRDQFIIAAIIGAGVFVVFMFALWIFAFRLLSKPDSKLAKGMILLHQENPQGGHREAVAEMSSLVGQRGIAVTMLRPVGTATFGDKRISVVAVGEYISVGTPVEVVEVRGAKVVVKSCS